MRKLCCIGLCILFFPLFVIATEQVTTPLNFQEGKDFQTIVAKTPATTPTPPTDNKIHVIEFFSYGCPWCSRLDPALEKWLATKPANVEFQRVPVTFNPSWEILAKAYYAADALGIADKITPAIFTAIHKDNMRLDSEDALASFFSKYGVSKSDFDSAFSFSPGIDAQLNRGKDLMTQYQILSVPTIIVNGKYKTDTGMNSGDINKMIKVVAYLVTQANSKK